MRFLVEAFQALDAAGHKVTPADRVPGLWNVEGIADDVTSGQLLDIARQHGQSLAIFGPAAIILNPGA